MPCSCMTENPSAKEMWPMCSTPPPMATSCTPDAMSAAEKLTACWAEPHWRAARAGAAAEGGVRPARRDERGGEVDGLLGGTALAVDRGGGGLDRQAGLEPGVAAD